MYSQVTAILSMLVVAALGKSLNKEMEFDVICHESQDGLAVYVPHPYDCSLYFQCVGLSPTLMSCPPGLYFDPTITVCNWPEFVDCHNSSTTTTPSYSTSISYSSTTTSWNTTTTPSFGNKTTTFVNVTTSDLPESTSIQTL